MTSLKRSSWNLLLVVGVVTLALVATACGGSTPKAADTSPPSAQAATGGSTAPLVIVDSVVQGSANIPDDETASKSCVLNNRYKKNEEVVWRIKVIDPATGEALGDADLTKVEVTLSDGQTFTAKYGDHPHGAPTDSFWATGWEIPEDYPSGTVSYTINAEAKDGRTGKYVSFDVAPSNLIVLDEAVAVQTQ